MTEPLQVGQFAIVDHEPVDRGPNAGIFHGKGPSDDRAELFILAEGTTPAGEAFAGHIVSALGGAFSSLDMSLTGALRRLFQEAEGNLADWNRKSIAQHRVSIGLTCFGRRGDQAVVAQAGPSAVFHLHHGKVEPYFADEEHGQPIGAVPIEPQLTRIPFSPGDRLLLISSVALRHLDDELIGGILKLPHEQVLPELYHRLHDLRHLTALLVTGAGHAAEPEDGELVIDATASEGALLPPPEAGDAVVDATAAAAAAGTPSAPPPGLYQPSLFIDDHAEGTVMTARRQLLDVTPRRQIDAVVPAVVMEMPTPLARVSGESPLARMAAERQARASIAHSAAQAALAQNALRTAAQAARRASAGTITGRPAWHNSGNSGNGNAATPAGAPGSSRALPAPRRRHERHDSFSRGLVHEEIPARPDPNLEVLPLVDVLAEEHRGRGASSPLAADTIAGEAAVSMSGGGSLVRVRGDMGGRWKSGGFARRTTTNGALPPTWLVIVVGLAVLLVLVGIMTVPGMLSQQSSARYAGLLDGAQQKIATAQVQTDPAGRRKALTDAQALLLEAKDAKGATAQASTLLAEVSAQLAAMDSIKAPASVTVVGSLQQFGNKPVSAIRLAVGGQFGYVLDNASNSVIALPLGGGNYSVVFQEDASKKQARPIAANYVASGDPASEGLLIADAAQHLWSFSPTAGVHQLAFALPSGARVTDMTTSGGNLYVLDAAQSVVYKFIQGSGGYGAAPQKLLDTPDLAAARRLTVDGNEIITVDANGTIHRFSGTVGTVLSEAGIDTPLNAPEAAQPIGNNGDFAFLDATNDRIIVIHRDGTFAGQYRDKSFAASSEFTMSGGVGYLFSDGMLRKVTF